MKCKKCDYEARTQRGLDQHERQKHPQSALLKAALSGDEREILTEALAMLAEEAENATGAALSGIVREMRALTRDLKALGGTESNGVDKLSEQREARRAKTARRKRS